MATILSGTILFVEDAIASINEDFIVVVNKDGVFFNAPTSELHVPIIYYKNYTDSIDIVSQDDSMSIELARIKNIYPIFENDSSFNFVYLIFQKDPVLFSNLIFSNTEQFSIQHISKIMNIEPILFDNQQVLDICPMHIPYKKPKNIYRINLLDPLITINMDEVTTI